MEIKSHNHKSLFEVTSSLKIPDWIQLAMEQYEIWKVDQEGQQKYLLFHHIKIYEGKPTLNFLDQHSIISLTKCILRVVFGLKWNLPLNNLCPRVPNRLNYLIWIHKYVLNMDAFQYKQQRNEIFGIDIGTGASLIYPLLGNKIFGWKFMATQIDQSSIKHAQHLVKINKIEKQIKIVKGNPSHVLKDTIISEKKFDFLMCNPPFFDSLQSSPTPLSVMTSGEHNTFGGQYEFFFKLYSESFYYYHIRYFSMMVGLGRNFEEIRTFLESEMDQYGNLDWLRFGKLNQSGNSRFVVAWKININKLKSVLPKQQIFNSKLINSSNSIISRSCSSSQPRFHSLSSSQRQFL